MAARRVDSEHNSRRRPPATTPEARENQLIALAYDEAERQILSGKATSQLLTHFLKRGTAKDKLEEERLRQETLLTQKKIETMQSQKDTEKLLSEALNAFRSYAGAEEENYYED